MSEPDFKRVCIIGVGLIGGSFGGALKKRWPGRVEVIGAGRTKENLELAQKRGLIDRWSLEPEEAVQGADLVVLATPVGHYEEVLQRIRTHLPHGAVVTDAGSVKTVVVELFRRLLPEGTGFVGAHPIAGSEKSGPSHAKDDLFEGNLCILTPEEETPEEVLDRVRFLWQSVGSEVVIMSPELHDRVFALVSHLPHVVAYGLVRTVMSRMPEAISYAGKGFNDTTRIARSSATLWADICGHNRENLIDAIEAFIKEMTGFLESLKNDNKNSLTDLFQEAVQFRGSIEDDC